jgi:hypothetical protein
LIANGSFGAHTPPMELSYAEILELSEHFGSSLLKSLLKLGFDVSRQSLERKFTSNTVKNARKNFKQTMKIEKIIRSLKAPALFLQSNSDSSPSPSPIVEVDSFATVSTI